MKILIAGEGGQGVQLIAEILAKAAFLEGKKSLYIPNFGVEQRGGVSLAFVTIENNFITYPKFEKADILAILCNRAVERVVNYIKPETLIILGPAVTLREIKEASKECLFFVPPDSFPSKVWNILVLGKINRLSNVVSFDSLEKVMTDKLRDKFLKDENLKKLNQKALVFFK